MAKARDTTVLINGDTATQSRMVNCRLVLIIMLVACDYINVIYGKSSVYYDCPYFSYV
jgi:hypothetical protein